MLNLDRIQTKPRLMRAMTGLTTEQLTELLDAFVGRSRYRGEKQPHPEIKV